MRSIALSTINRHELAMFSSKFQHLAEIEAMHLRRQAVARVSPGPLPTVTNEQQIRTEMERRCLEYLAKRKARPHRAA